MKTRIVTGIAGACVLMGALWWGGWSWRLLVTLLALMAYREMMAFIGVKAKEPLSLIGYILLAALLMADLSISFVLLFGFIALAVLSLRNHTHLHVERLAVALLAFLYIGFGFYASVLFYGTHGKIFVLYLLLLIWASDSFAYFVGYFFGKTPMAPVLSPKKTMEGLAGGILGTMLLAYFLDMWFGLGQGWSVSLVTGALVALLAPLGDLFESSMKRYYGVKDAGNILPGHGGILDRFDSFLFVMTGLALLYYLL